MPIIDVPESNRSGRFGSNLSPEGGTFPAIGSVVRSNGVAGEYVSAQGDTIAHVSGILGLYVGGASNVVPLDGVRDSCLFDGTPTIGSPVYVSASDAGELTTTPSLIGLLPIGVCTASASGSGTVYFGAQSQSSGASSLDALNVEYSLMTGASPGKSVVTFDEFDLHSIDSKWATVATCAKVADGLSMTGATAGPYFNNSMGNIAPASVPFMLAMRITTPGAGYWSLRVTDGTRFFDLNGGGVSPGQLTFIQSGAAPAVVVATGVDFTVAKVLKLISDGFGNFRISFNGGAWSAPIASTVVAFNNGGQFLLMTWAGASPIILDYIYFARQIRTR